MKLDLIRHPDGNTSAPSILIAALLLLGVASTVIAGSLGLLVGWVFSIFHPVIFVVMTFTVALWVGIGFLQGLILFDIAIGRPGLSLIRLVGSVCFVVAGWGVGYFLIEDGANSHYYSPLSAWALTVIQCSVVFPLLVLLTSFVLSRGRAPLLAVYLLCFPVLWWWGAVGFPAAVESVTHSNAESVVRQGREERSAREHNLACLSKISAIRGLDPIVDARRVFAEHGVVYVPWIARFPGLAENETNAAVHESRLNLAVAKRVAVESLPDALDFPPDTEGVNLIRYTRPLKERFMEDRRAYMAAFNLEMDRLAEPSRE